MKRYQGQNPATRNTLRTHKSYMAFLGHRLSGIALAIFLPVHFLVLGLALEGAETMDRFLKFTDLPFVKAAEWGLVVMLSLHFLFGMRVLMLELTDWPKSQDNRTGWIIPFTAIALFIGLIFILQT